jgi:hypothetical protein
MKKYLALTDAEVEALPFTRQHKQNIRRYRARQCLRCKEPVADDSTHCMTCRKAGKGGPRRDWSKADWTQSIEAIAEAMGVSREAVRYQAKLRGVKVGSQRQTRWDRVDWRWPDRMIADEFGVSRATVFSHRRSALARAALEAANRETQEK